MLLIARPILDACGVGFGLLDAGAGSEAASALAGVAAAAGAGRGDVLVFVVEALGDLLPRGCRAAAAPGSGGGRKVALVGLGICVDVVVDLGAVEVRREAVLGWGVGGGGVRVWIHGPASPLLSSPPLSSHGRVGPVVGEGESINQPSLAWLRVVVGISLSRR
uniref:Uncharacterized protein n=1 Tax=Arundo donax TaxID=35708 RepID=A0A0A9CZG3_ARUDO